MHPRRTGNGALTTPTWEPPTPGHPLAVAPGILWLRFALPFALDHVNIYLIEDDGGWAIFDAGYGDESTRATWDQLLAGPLAGMTFTRLFVSHHHPDHVGLAGWLTQRLSIPLYMHEREYLLTRHMSRQPTATDEARAEAFYVDNGLRADEARLIATRGMRYRKAVDLLPAVCHSIEAGDVIRIGGRAFTAVCGGGHSSSQLMLWCAENNLLLSADQVMLRISPNISVEAMFPTANPLGAYLLSLSELRRLLPENSLVLPGHNIPFCSLHSRLDQLTEHHRQRLDMITKVIADGPLSIAEIVPILFKRTMDAHQLGFAFGETLAHVNYLVLTGSLRQNVNGTVQALE